MLVVNCSLFNPTPSLSAMIINKFKMRSNIISYNLSGMGCSSRWGEGSRSGRWRRGRAGEGAGGRGLEQGGQAVSFLFF